MKKAVTEKGNHQKNEGTDKKRGTNWSPVYLLNFIAEPFKIEPFIGRLHFFLK